MKKILLSICLIASSGVINASSINRVDFNTTAIEYGFDGLSAGITDVNSGNLSVSNGSVSTSFDRGDTLVPTYFDGGDSSVIRLDFSNLISAIGLDFNSNNADTTLSIFGVTDNLLEEFTLTTANQFACSGFLCGFIGLNIGSNLISYATIDTPLNGSELFVDNIIYQSEVSSVPVPAAVWLFSSGLMGLLGMRKKAKLSVLPA